ncbi:hypothetical protein [Rhizobium jaguaris]|uniref:Uncharacterized protein n=1 Tax=Rhizobium jaguaris TaxID=1312183 RepID=A0A387FKP1_9HYPH|nr:hypothetical protein [Rhizobium jaguaris]AYG59448.1 hypothetical protein CCGE525_12060 [Rhizobium jaguaris]
MEFTLVAQILAWTTLGLILLGTVVPIGTKQRVVAAANIESIILFGLMGLLFVVAYPTDRRIIALLCILAATASESLLSILPDRHIRIERLVIKYSEHPSACLSAE